MAIALVQKSSFATISSGNTVSPSWPSPTQAGNLLVAVVSVSLDSSTNVAVTPPTGWSTAVNRSYGILNGIRLYIFYRENAPSESGARNFVSSVNITSGTNRGMAAVLLEYSGIVTSGSLDRTASTYNATGTAYTGSTSPTNQPLELAVGALFSYTVLGTFNGNGFTEQARADNYGGGSTLCTVCNHKFLTTTGAQQSSDGAGTNWIGAIATFRGYSPAVKLSGSLSSSAVLVAARLYTRLLAGLLACSGALLLVRAVVFLGVLSGGGQLAQALARTVAGVLDGPGQVSRLVGRALYGQGGLAGGLGLARVVRVVLEGALGSSALVTVSAWFARTLVGVCGGAGLVARQTARALVGALSPGPGRWVRSLARLLGGGLGLVGSGGQAFARTLLGAASLSGGMVRSLARQVGGGLVSQGALGKVRILFQSLSGLVGCGGLVVRLPRLVRTGGLGLGGERAQALVRTLLATLSPVGGLWRQPVRGVAGLLASSGLLVRSHLVVRTWVGALGLVGTASRRTARTVLGGLVPSGSLARRTFRLLAGGLVVLGEILAFNVRLVPRRVASLAWSGRALSRVRRSRAVILTQRVISGIIRGGMVRD